MAAMMAYWNHGGKRIFKVEVILGSNLSDIGNFGGSFETARFKTVACS